MKNKIKIAMPGTRTTAQLKKIRFVICNDFKIKKSWIEASTVDEYDVFRIFRIFRGHVHEKYMYM